MEDQIIRSKQSVFSHILKEQFLNHLVDVRVLGDWMFTGNLDDVRDKQEAYLSNVTVTSCQGLTLCSFEVDEVCIQLKDVTSIGKPTQ